MKTLQLLVLTFTLIAFSHACAEEAKTIRIGHFPNVTHAQALYGRATGEFEKQVGVPIEWSSFNAGPSAVEAFLADAIDVTYIGPNPAVNAFIKSDGKLLRIISGSATGGAALVVRKDIGIATEKDFADKTIATPQLGNTQDVAARAWFLSKGYKPKEKGGNLTLIPLSNPDQLLMLQKKEIDGAWTVEPWVSYLEIEGGGKLFLEEKTLWPDGQYVTSHIMVTTKFLEQNPKLIKKLIAAHVAATKKINTDKKAAASIINKEIARETGKALPAAVIQSAMARLTFTCDPIRSSLIKSADDAFQAGFLRKKPELTGIYDLKILNEALKEANLPEIQ